MSVSILIVNWNSKDVLRQCLWSIRRTCPSIVSEVIVVDSGSFDGCADMLAREFPEVQFMQSEENVGFGRANNLGFARATGEAVLVLNPDTELRPFALERLLDALRNQPLAGIVGPRLLNPDGSLQTSVHALPRPIRQALDSEWLRRSLSPFGLWAPPKEYSPPATVRVEAVAGTCMLMWSKTFRRLSGFSPQYFMYAEDMDLCFKVQKLGLRIYHVPSAEVLHHGGSSASVQGSTFSTVMIREALLLYMRANHGRVAAVTYRWTTGIAALGRLLAGRVGSWLTEEPLRTKHLMSMMHARAALRWACGQSYEK